MSDSDDSQNEYRSRYARQQRQASTSMRSSIPSRAYRPPNANDFRRRFSYSDEDEQNQKQSSAAQPADTMSSRPSIMSTASRHAATEVSSRHSSGLIQPASVAVAMADNTGNLMEVQEYADAHDAIDSEFVLRYTPVECGADQFAQNYLLRTMDNERKIKVFIVVTMYNEDEDELRRTLKGVLRNIDTFIEIEGPNAWEEVCVCLVSDGRDRANRGTLEYLEKLGLYDSDELHSALDRSTAIQMHLFETTLMIQLNEINAVNKPLQAMFALKEHGSGKLDSHLWFFNAFGAQLNPKYCFMVDVGTKPEKTAIYKLYQAMEKDENIGGCCGEITTRMSASINPWIAAQQFEYKISNILDKSMESVFGFISVLPGAFSAYRYAAIDGEPLNQYFKQINADISKISPFKGNMYLAEDRILCFEVLAEKNQKWKLKYVKGATAATDVPEQLTDLIKQRRRWLNGSMFAMIYAIGNFRKFLRQANHSRKRKSFIAIQFGYYCISLIFTWFLLATFYLMFEFSATSTSDDAEFAVQLFRAMFLILTFVQLVAGLGNRPEEMPAIYFLCAVGYGVFFLYTLGLNVELLMTEPDLTGFTDEEAAERTQQDLEAKIAAVTGFAIYFGAGLLHGELFSVVVSITQYFFMLPTFLIGFPIYSFCNIHDISWGTKGLETSDLQAGASRKQKEQNAALVAKHKAQIALADARFRTFRSNLVIGWISSNGIFYYFVDRYGSDESSIYIRFMWFAFLFINGFKFVFCCIYIFAEWFGNCSCCRRKRSTDSAENTQTIPE